MTHFYGLDQSAPPTQASCFRPRYAAVSPTGASARAEKQDMSRNRVCSGLWGWGPSWVARAFARPNEPAVTLIAVSLLAVALIALVGCRPSATDNAASVPESSSGDAPETVVVRRVELEQPNPPRETDSSAVVRRIELNTTTEVVEPTPPMSVVTPTESRREAVPSDTLAPTLPMLEVPAPAIPTPVLSTLPPVVPTIVPTVEMPTVATVPLAVPLAATPIASPATETPSETFSAVDFTVAPVVIWVLPPMMPPAQAQTVYHYQWNTTTFPVYVVPPVVVPSVSFPPPMPMTPSPRRPRF